MKVLVTSRSFGQVGTEALSVLEGAGIQMTRLVDDYTDEKFAETIPEYDALIIGAHKFPAEVMERCGRLQIIAKHGAGLDNIDLEAAKRLGITVTNVPATNANAVADLAVAHMLNLCRGVSAASWGVKNGVWKVYIGRDMYAKTLGLVGFGNIAKNVARRARGFSMKVLAYDPYITEVPEEFQDYVTIASLDEVCAKSDFVSVHVPLTEETRNMFDRKRLDMMKTGAFLINTSRGGIVEEQALFEVCKEGKLGGAALDVVETEPLPADSPLLALSNVVITPHIGMYSYEAVNAVSVTCAENVAKKLGGETPRFVVV